MSHSRGIDMIARPIISPDFTIEDIHKIREQNYERTKDKFFVCQFPILPQNTNKYSE